MANQLSQIAQAKLWVKASMRLFGTQPSRWLVIATAYLFFMLVFSALHPFIAILSIALWPAVSAYILLIFRNVEMGSHASAHQLFLQLQNRLLPLLKLGFCAIVYLALIGWLMNDDLAAIATSVQNSPPSTEAERVALLQQLLPPYLTFMALLIPLFIVTWFSPLLIVLNQYAVVKAMKSSLAGVLQYFGALNLAWLLLTLYLLLLSVIAGVLVAITGLAVLSTFLFGGIALLGTSLFFALQYLSYRDVFKAAPVVQTA